MRTILGSMLQRYSALLHKAGNQGQARVMMARSLEVQEPLVGRANVSPTVLNEYAFALLKCEYPDMRDAGKALDIMLKVDRMSNSSNPIFLDTLTWAYYRTGNVRKAIETDTKALSLLPTGQQSGLKAEIEASVAEFEKAVRQ